MRRAGSLLAEWDDAARALGMSIDRRGMKRRRMEGEINRLSLYVHYHPGSEGSSATTSFCVKLPPGDWDDHRMVVRKRGRFGRRGRGRTTNDSLDEFDRMFKVRVRGKRRDPDAVVWCDQFLTARRRQALLDLVNRIPSTVHLTTSPLPSRRSELTTVVPGLADGEQVRSIVSAMVDCVEALSSHR